MKEHAETTHEQEHQSIMSSMQVTTRQLFKHMLKLMSRCVTNVNASATSLDNHQSISPPMMAQWPFAQWGLDNLGPFSLGTKQTKFLVVGFDYFTKWVEAEPLAKVTQQNVKNFVWENIVYRFGVSTVLVSENGRQFDNTPFKDFCEQFGIKNHYSSPSHP